MFDQYTIVPIAACVYAYLIFPLLLVSCSPDDAACLLETRPESKIFWPAMAVIAVILAARNYHRLTWPPHIICLFVYLSFAGISVLWAFRPDLSFIRFAQQVMIVTSIVLPAMLAPRTSDTLRGIFLCLAFAAALNLIFVLGGTPQIVNKVAIGYAGYFDNKNYLGQFSAIVFLLALYEMLHPGRRRLAGIVVIAIATSLLLFSNSKTAFGLAILAPVLAGLTLLARKFTRFSPALILWSIPICYVLFSVVSGFSLNRISYLLYGDPTFTGRTTIWDFANLQIARSPLLGWGYQSFWHAGHDAPSIADAPGWVKNMPNAHNGYLDTMLEMGYLGFALLLAFITATLHAIGRMADRDLSRAWLVLSLALYIIITNGLESSWMRGFEMLWLMFLVVAAEAARYWQPIRSGARSHALRATRSVALPDRRTGRGAAPALAFFRRP